MRRWWLLIALLLSLGVNLGLFAAVATRKMAARPRAEALPPEGPREPGADVDPLPRFRRLADHLGLEGEQRRRFLDLQRQLFEETLRVRMRQSETHREVRRELTSHEPDRERIETLLRQASRDFLTLEQALARNILATREILDPDQQEEYLRVVSRMRPPGPGGFGQQQQPPPGRRRLPPMRDRRFPRDQGPPPEFEEGRPPL